MTRQKSRRLHRIISHWLFDLSCLMYCDCNLSSIWIERDTHVLLRSQKTSPEHRQIAIFPLAYATLITAHHVRTSLEPCSAFASHHITSHRRCSTPLDGEVHGVGCVVVYMPSIKRIHILSYILICAPVPGYSIHTHMRRSGRVHWNAFSLMPNETCARAVQCGRRCQYAMCTHKMRVASVYVCSTSGTMRMLSRSECIYYMRLVYVLLRRRRR